MQPKMFCSWQLRGFGLDRLVQVEQPIPTVGPHEVLVRVKAVSLNHRDLLMIGGRLAPELPFPYTPASDAAGEVVAAGREVRRLQVGERVVAHAVTAWIDGAGPSVLHEGLLSAGLPGVLSEYILLHEDALIATPPGLSDVEAATLPIAALTAWSALIELPKTRPGEIVLIQGTGGVALFALQFSVAFGLRAIITSSSDDKLARAAKLGAWRCINYSNTPDWDRAALDLTGGSGVEHVLELAGGDSLARSVNALAIGGQLSLIGILEKTESFLPTGAVTRKRISIQGVAMGSRKAFERMNSAIEAKAIRPVVDAVYPFEEAPSAFDHLASGPFGKVAISLN